MISQNIYDSLYKKSISPDTREQFWKEQLDEIYFETKPNVILDQSNPPFYKWFPDGKLNMCYNALDRHIKSNHGDTKAIIWESCYGLPPKTITYNELYIEVNKLSKILLNLNITKGDRVIIYMPLIYESIVAMMSCWRIGAVHSVVFGGFASSELADRINDSSPKIIITSSVGIEPRKKINYFKNVSNAIKMANSNAKVMIIQREDVLITTKEEIEAFKNETKNNNDVLIYNEEMKKIPNDTFVQPVIVNSTDPVYILYTSGTTGQPKGIVRDTGGCVVTANYTMKYIMNINQGDISFCSSDIGWIVGHLFMVYGPLIRGATTILLEGKPVGTPDCSVCFNIIQKYKVKAFYSCPTAIRAIKREDPELKIIRKYDLSSLESVELSGERCDPESFKWCEEVFGNKVLINDHWWQTESGYPICCNNINIYRFPSKPGVTGHPNLGFNVQIVDLEKNEEITKPHIHGAVCIKLPTPPSFMTTLYNNDEAFLQRYISENKQYYITGDIGCWDEEGNVVILSRRDDMIKIAGHRLTTGRMEEVIMKVKEVAEVAVVAVNDMLKGELPFAFCVLKSTTKSEDEVKIVNSIKEIIASNIGAISRLKGVCVVNRLPKTRSGKIIRALLKSIINNEEYTIPPTIEDKKVVEEVKNKLKADKLIK